MRDDARTVPACDIRTVLEPVIRARGLRHVARCADVTPGAISQWLAGTSDLRLATLRRVVRACGYELVVRRLRGRRRRSAVACGNGAAGAAPLKRAHA